MGHVIYPFEIKTSRGELPHTMYPRFTLGVPSGIRYPRCVVDRVADKLFPAGFFRFRCLGVIVVAEDAHAAVN